MPLLEVKANGAVELSSDLQTKVNDLNIKFHGDMLLPENPTTFQEAVKVYKELPNFVTGPNGNSVPMKVHLAPLKMLDPSGTFNIIRDISESLISDVLTIIQELEDAREEALDLSRSPATRYFSFIDINIDRCSTFFVTTNKSFKATLLLSWWKYVGQEEKNVN